MQARISSREFAEWMAYYSLEPWGEERADLRMGIVASLIANANRDPKKRSQPFTPEDFIPRFERGAARDLRGPGDGWQGTKRRFMALVGKR